MMMAGTGDRTVSPVRNGERLWMSRGKEKGDDPAMDPVTALALDKRMKGKALTR